MKVKLIERTTEKEKVANVLKINKKELPLVRDGWNFNWRKLFKVKGTEIFKVVLDESPAKIQGVVMLTLLNDEMVFMNNVEIAPHNIGENKLFTNTAGVLLAFACKKVLRWAKGII